MKVNVERSGKMEVSKMCFECGAKDNFEYKDTVRVYEGDGYYFEMLVKIPFCRHCNAPIYDEETEREIALKANEKIRAQRNIITREEILDILESYKISQKFLSKLLGWGEITLTRYVNGNYTPNPVNSNRLKSLKNPYIFQMLLQNYREKQLEQSEEKSFIKAQNQVYQRIEELIKKQGKIFNVVNWFLAQSSEEVPITHLALQKLLYFVQSWSALLLGKDLFWDDCQAWAHGAVYPKVYVLFKEFRYKPLPKVEKVEEEVQEQTVSTDEEAREEQTVQEMQAGQTNENGWDTLVRSLGLEGLGDITGNLGYILAMLPDILLGVLTGKTQSLGIKDNLLPIASIVAGVFIKNPILKMLLIGMGGANLLIKAGHEMLGREQPNRSTDGGNVQYKHYTDEPLNPRIVNPVLQGNTLIATIDRVPCTVQLSPTVADAYRAGALPLNTLANAILAQSDRLRQIASQNYDNGETETVVRTRGIQ